MTDDSPRARGGEGIGRMMMLVDAANILMRCAFGGETPPETSVPMAVAMIERAARVTCASHMVIALDYPGAPTWRHLEYPEYKANRSVDTAPWLVAGASAFAGRGWHCEVHSGFEADDIIATIALRAANRARVAVLSGDSDLLALTEHASIEVHRPQTGGDFQSFAASDVCEKYKIPRPYLLFDYKAMVGEKSDNIAGVPGIGAVRAASLLSKLGDLDAIIHAGKGGFSKDATKVAEHADTARRARKLVSLDVGVPVPPIAASRCALSARPATREPSHTPES